MAESSRLVVVVDDDAPVLKALRRLLRGRGFDASTYESAQAFLTALPERTPDCLIVDLQMPGMTGLELHRYLVRKGVKIPTIVITARGDEETHDLCMAAGMIAYFKKPLPISSLLTAIEAAGQS